MRLTITRILDGKHMSTVIYDPSGWESVAALQRDRLHFFKNHRTDQCEKTDDGVRITSRFGVTDVYVLVLSESKPRTDGVTSWTEEYQGRKATCTS